MRISGQRQIGEVTQAGQGVVLADIAAGLHLAVNVVRHVADLDHNGHVVSLVACGPHVELKVAGPGRVYQGAGIHYTGGMLKSSRRLMLAGLPALALCPAPAFAAMSLAAAIAGPWRSAKNMARDRYRHPAAVLGFFGLTARQRVLEIEPGGGYWTEILAPYLKPAGLYIAAIPSVGPEAGVADARFLAKLAADPGLYGDVEVTGLDVPPLGAPESVDMVLSFRNLHDWMADGTVGAKLAAVHAVLRPGGVFGIEDHRGAVSAPQDSRAKSGYVRQDYARALITAAGFRLAGTSEVGANPLDTKDYPKGVWTLPPTLAAGAVDRARYLAIGESDRWTMKFVK